MCVLPNENSIMKNRKHVSGTRIFWIGKVMKKIDMGLNNTKEIEIRRKARWLLRFTALIALTNLFFTPSSFAGPNSNLECTSSGLEAMIKEVDAFFNQENRNDSFIKVNHISDKYLNPKCNLFEQFKIMLAYGFKVNGQKENEIELEIPLLKDRWFLLFRPGLQIIIRFNKDNKITEVYSYIANVTL